MNKIKQLAPLKTEPNEDHYDGVTRFRYQKATAHKRIKSESVTDRFLEDFTEIKNEAANKFRSARPDKISQGMVQQDPRAVEEWIGDMLIQAEGGTYDTASRRDTLRRYGIDKKSLKNYGLDLECITRLHRSMFIYTFGFHRMLLDTLSYVKEKDTVLLKYWRVFTILLQYSSKEEYMTVLSQQEKEYQIQLDALKKKLLQQQAEYDKMHVQEQYALNKMTTEFTRIKNDNDQLIHDKKHIELTLLAREEAFNDEIARRVKFENKLNTIYSVHKELLTKHTSLMEDLKAQRLKNDALEKTIDEKDQRILSLNERIVHHQGQVADLSDELIRVKNQASIAEQKLEISKSQLNQQLQKLNDGEKFEKENQLSKDTMNIKLNSAFSQVYLLNDEIKTLKTQNWAITKQRDDISQQLIEMTKKKEELELKLIEVNHDFQLTDQNLKNLEQSTSQNLDRLEKALSEIVQQSQLIKRLESDNEFMSSQVILKDKVNTELRGGVQKLVIEQEKALDKIKEYERRIQIYEMQVQELEKKQSFMRADMTQVQLQKTEAELQVNLLKNQLFVNQQEDEKIIESLNTKNVAFSQENLRHTQTISGLSKTIMQLRGNVMNLQTDIDRLLMTERSLTIENQTLKEQSSQYQRSYDELEQRLQNQVQEQNKDQYEVFHLKRKVYAISLLLKLISASMGKFALETFIETSQRQVNNSSFGIDAKSQINVKNIFDSLLEIDHDLHDPSLYHPQQGAIKFSELAQNQDLIQKIEQYKMAKFNMEKERDGFKRMAIILILICKKKYLDLIALRNEKKEWQENEKRREQEALTINQKRPVLRNIQVQTDMLQIFLKNETENAQKQMNKVKKVRTTLAGDDDLRIFQQLQEQKFKQKQRNQVQSLSQDRTIDQDISDASPNKSFEQQQQQLLSNTTHLNVPTRKDDQTQTSKPPTARTSRNSNQKVFNDQVQPLQIAITPFDNNYIQNPQFQKEMEQSPTVIQSSIQMSYFSQVNEEAPESTDQIQVQQTDQNQFLNCIDPELNTQLLNINKPTNQEFKSSRSDGKDNLKKSPPQRNIRRFQKLYQNASSFYSRKNQ